ncbi:hypothetical protein C0Q70_10172 [Pomacea canaliculata]|uniref:Major vault protein n=1 Tax=Pomacea canaliculata TaxID=400727 RepID=A0A2T7PBV1_POMCA|nr:hypothetical protein C0Q70_10172 [Pomacea canaliculata]
MTAMNCLLGKAFCKWFSPPHLPELRVKFLHDADVNQLVKKHSHFCIRQEPFPLYPGETLPLVPDFGLKSEDYSKALQAMPVVPSSCALRLRAVQDFLEDGIQIPAGHEWYVEGPMTYIPRPEVEVISLVQPLVIKTGEVLRIRAVQDTRDQDGNNRVTGEEWLVTEPGAYLPGVWEEVCGRDREERDTYVDTGLYLQAVQNLTDSAGVNRCSGDEWLVTGEDVEEYTPQVGIVVSNHVRKIVIKKDQYAVIINPVGPDGKNALGRRELRKGLCSFFLHPGEILEDGKVQNAYLLTEDESMVLQAWEEFKDTMFNDRKRKPGERWMILGPLLYIPPTSVKIIKRSKTIPLSKNEGIYIQNTQTGKVRAVMGPTAYMLTEFEELWEKELPEDTERLLRQGGGEGSADIRKVAYFEQSIDPAILKGRDKTRVVTYRCPGNTAVQVNNFQQKTARVVFGPDLVVLEPEESFQVLSLSGGKPKVENSLKSLCLMLGPDFITDILEVETSDHARLHVQVAFNNHFEVDKNDPESAKKIFSVPDFIGFVCRQIGSHIRGAVALTPFDDFHRHSSTVIQTAVFGKDANGQLNTYLKFDVNNLVISSIDIQNIEPVDTKMRDSLSKSVQMAIEISTREQIAQGQLEQQRLANEVEAEKERAKLYELRALAAAVESTGQATAEAQAQAEKTIIECQSEIETVKLRTRAEEIEHYAKLEIESLMRTQEIDYKQKLTKLEISKEKTSADIEVDKFAKMVHCLGTETITSMATGGQQCKVRLLQALGLEATLFTNGMNPINLFTTASGLVGDTSAE